MSQPLSAKVFGLSSAKRHSVDPHQFLGIEINPRAAEESKQIAARNSKAAQLIFPLCNGEDVNKLGNEKNRQ
jgi:hypothetical protein